MLPIKNGRILNITFIIFKSIIKILIIPSANNISAFIKYIFFFFFFIIPFSFSVFNAFLFLLYYNCTISIRSIKHLLIYSEVQNEIIKKMCQTIYFNVLVIAIIIPTFCLPVSAESAVNQDEIRQQIEYYESIQDYDDIEKIVDETLPYLFPSNTGIETRAGLSPSVILDILAAYGMGYGGGYAVGTFCKNHNIPYAAGLASLLIASSMTGGILFNPMKAVLTLGYDNGYNS